MVFSLEYTWTSTGELWNKSLCLNPEVLMCSQRTSGLGRGPHPGHYEVPWKKPQHWGQWAVPAALPVWVLWPLKGPPKLLLLSDQYGPYHKCFNTQSKLVFPVFVKSWQKFPFPWTVTGMQLTLEQHFKSPDFSVMCTYHRTTQSMVSWLHGCRTEDMEGSLWSYTWVFDGKGSGQHP